MKSCIYEGTIRHRRYRPRPNIFQYRLFLAFIDLSEIKTVFQLHPLWSNEQLNIAYFRRRDHFGDPRRTLEQSVRDLVAERIGDRPQGPIRLLTHLRYFGFCFNPASFYYCYDVNDTHVETIVVEIHNTPWGERYCYVLGTEHNEHPLRNWRRYRFAKNFHVSPFIHMNINYDWRFSEPGNRVRVHMIDIEDGQPLFDASLALKRLTISRRTMSRMLVKYPLMTVKVTAMIYWQALRLVMKKTPFFTHPKKTGANQVH